MSKKYTLNDFGMPVYVTEQEAKEALKGDEKVNGISDKCLICHWYCDEVLEECRGEEKPCREFLLARDYRDKAGEENDNEQ